MALPQPDQHPYGARTFTRGFSDSTFMPPRPERNWLEIPGHAHRNRHCGFLDRGDIQARRHLLGSRRTDWGRCRLAQTRSLLLGSPRMRRCLNGTTWRFSLSHLDRHPAGARKSPTEGDSECSPGIAIPSKPDDQPQETDGRNEKVFDRFPNVNWEEPRFLDRLASSVPRSLQYSA